MFDKIYKALQEAKTAEPEVPVRPYIPTKSPKERPANPIVPVPKKSPKPKASNPDVELFLKSRDKLTEMAFDAGRFPSFVNPEKKDWIEAGDEELSKILPELSDGEQSYLEMITSDNYQDMLQKLETYTGIDASDMRLPQIVSLVHQSVPKAIEIEQKHKEELEKFALDTVLNFPEFAMVKDAYEAGHLRFEIELTDQLFDTQISDDKDEDDLTDEEEMNVDFADEFEDVNELDLQRRLANILMQGNAMLKTYLFPLVRDKLVAIDDKLPNLYGLIASGAQLGYWVVPPAATDGDTSSMGAGKEEVVPEEDGYVIKAKSVVFPYLLHELVKGIYEWISISEETGKARGMDTLAKETEDLLVGPKLVKILSSYIDNKHQYLIPLIYKKFIKLPMEQVKMVFAEKGDDIMKELIDASEAEWADYIDAKDNEEVEF